MSDPVQIEPIIGWPAYCDEIMSLLSLTQLEVSNLKVEVVDLTDALDEQGRTANARKVVIEQKDARIADLEAENERLRKALEGAFCVLLLDGRNEHGSHVLSGYPRSFEVSDEDLSEQAEAILCEGEKLGFSEGSLVWANFSWVPPQIGDEGRVELDGYWDFSGINPELSKILEAKP